MSLLLDSYKICNLNSEIMNTCMEILHIVLLHLTVNVTSLKIGVTYCLQCVTTLQPCYDSIELKSALG